MSKSVQHKDPIQYLFIIGMVSLFTVLIVSYWQHITLGKEARELVQAVEEKYSERRQADEAEIKKLKRQLFEANADYAQKTPVVEVPDEIAILVDRFLERYPKDRDKRAEIYDALDENILHYDLIEEDIRYKLCAYTLAIRIQENGSTWEFGCLPTEDGRSWPGYRKQAGCAAATVRKNWERWASAGARGLYIQYLGERWAPVGADNDPDNLNKYWIGGVDKIYRELMRGGLNRDVAAYARLYAE